MIFTINKLLEIQSNITIASGDFISPIYRGIYEIGQESNYNKA